MIPYSLINKKKIRGFFFYVQIKNMAIEQKTERAFLYVVFYLVLLHIIVSLVFAFLDYSRSGTKDAHGILVWSGTAWVVSLLVCLTVLVLILYSLRYEKQLAETPTPIQFSFPGFGKDRQDIQNFLKSVLESVVDPSSNIIPLPYDKSRVYIVLTKYYLKKLKSQYPDPTSTPSPSLNQIDIDLDLIKKLSPIIQKYDTIPIGYVVGEKIYTLTGTQIWPISLSS